MKRLIHGWLILVALLLAGTSVEARAINFAWDASPDARVTGYRIRYGTQTGIYTQSLDVGNQTSGQLNLADGTLYYIAVEGYDASGVPSAPSNEVVTAPSLTNPGNQSNFVGDAVSLQLNASTVAGRVLTFSATGLPSPLSVNPSTGVISGSLQTTTAGVYNVTATVTDGIGAPASVSFSWTVTTPVINPPGAFNKTSPANGATGQATSLTLSWGASSNATSYEYCYDTTNDNACSAWTSTGAAISVGVSGLSTGTTYYWQVRATNAGGTTYANASSTSYRSFTTQVAAPGAFSMTSPANGATGQSTSLTLSWGASTNATTYEYCYDTTNDSACSAWTSAGTAVSAGVSGLNTGATYYWLVRATNAGGTTYAGSSTSYRSFTTQVAAPGAFSMTSPANGATGQATSLTLSWGASSNATSYEYCYDTTNDSACSAWTSAGTAVAVSAGVSGLNTGATYYWLVRATNAGGTTYAGSSTSYRSFTTQVAAPGAFSMTSPANGATGQATSLTLSWGASTNATSYEYCYDTTNDNACSAWTSAGTAVSAGVSGLNTGATYYWLVRATNAGGTTYAGSSTSYRSFTTQVAAPGAFSMTSPVNGATGQATSLTLSWGASTNATSYEYCYDTTNDNACSTWTSAGTAVSAGVSGLNTGATYYWLVRATNAGGTTYANASSTAYWSFTTQTAGPGAFSKTSPANGATGQATSLTLSWGASSAATGYEYCYDTTNDNACSAWTSAGAAVSVGLSGLSAGTVYYWQVRATNTGGTTYANAGGTSYRSFMTQVAPPGAFNMTSPANGATGQATSVTLSWGASSTATGYQYCYDTTNDNACSTWTSAGTAVSVGVSGLSTGTTYYWLVRATNAGGTTYANGSSTAYRNFTTQAAVPAQLTVPAPASTLTSSAVTFQWTGGTGVTGYYLQVGTTSDGADLYDQDLAMNLSATVSGLPTDGRVIYVRLYSRINGNWQSTVYPYTAMTAAATSAKAEMTVPAPASTLTSSTVTFQWTGGTGVTQYYLQVGTTSGGADLFDQDRATNLTATVSGLPTDGRAIYVRLYSRINGDWQSTIYPYTAMTAAATSAKAEMTVPAPASTLTGSTVTFQWTGGTGVTQYYLQIGTTSGGADLFDQDRGTSLTATVSGLPTDGRAIYARLYSRINGDWQYTIYPYTTGTTGGTGTPAPAQMTVPAPASTLTSSTVTFQWTGGTGVTQYYLQVGTTSGGTDLFDQDRGTSLTATVSGLPTDGRAIYARLYSRINGNWQSMIYPYTAVTTGGTPAPAQMTVPAPASTLTSSTVTFQWTGGTGVTQYYLQVGTTSGGADLFDQDRGTSLTATVSGLPTDGRAIYARLYSRINGNWQSMIYPYTAVTTGGTPAPAQMTVPAPSSTLTSSTVTFQWTGGTGVTQYYLQVGTTMGGGDLYDHDQAMALTATVSGLPTDGRTVYVRLWSMINGNWQSTFYTYTAATP